MVIKDRGRLDKKISATTPIDVPWKAIHSQLGLEEYALNKDSRKVVLPSKAMVHRVSVVASPRADVHAAMIPIFDYAWSLT